MAAITFPEYELVLSWDETVPNSVLRTPMEGGLPKQARRFTRPLRHLSMNLLMSDAQYDAFLDWWEDDAEHGSQFFDVVDPRTGSTIEGRMINGQYQASHLTRRQTYWSVSFEMETFG